MTFSYEQALEKRYYVGNGGHINFPKVLIGKRIKYKGKLHLVKYQGEQGCRGYLYMGKANANRFFHLNCEDGVLVLKEVRKMKCSICGLEYVGWGNNAEPVNSGRCCDVCNVLEVIPARLKQMEETK